MSSRLATPSSTTSTDGSFLVGPLGGRLAATAVTACSDWPAVGHAAGVRAATNSVAVWKRSDGDLASARRSASSAWRDSSPRSSCIAGIALFRCDSSTAAGVSASNGTRPVSISYATIANA